MEITRKLLYHATAVKNVQLDDPPYGESPDAILIELNTEDGQYHSISLPIRAAKQLLRQLTDTVENLQA